MTCTTQNSLRPGPRLHLGTHLFQDYSKNNNGYQKCKSVNPLEFDSKENCCFDFSHIFYGFVDKYHFWPKIAKFGNIPSSLASFVKKLETYSTEKSLIPKSCNTLKGTTSILQFFWSRQYFGHYGPKLVASWVLRPSPK